MKRLGLILLLAAALTLAACNGAEETADNGPAAAETAAAYTNKIMPAGVQATD